MSSGSVPKALETIAAGGMVILVDDEDRENEGDLCLAAEKVTAESINFMAKYGRGLICLTLEEDHIEQLQLPMMVHQNTSQFETAFTISIEARDGVTTGISAQDRATTILAAVADGAQPEHLVSPGHIFPLRARAGGVLVRTGQTEGSVDLARLAGLKSAGVICEIMNDDGSMARMNDLERFAAKHQIPMLSVADLIEYRLQHDSLVSCLTERLVEHPIWGEIKVAAFGSQVDERQHLVVIKGDISGDEPPLVRVQAGYPLSHVLGDVLTDERALLNAALEHMENEQRGVLICLDRGLEPNPCNTL